MKDAYLDWLTQYIEDEGHGAEEYKVLLRHLHSREFVALVERDTDRIGDCMNLRASYASETGDPVPDRPVSLLEVMVSLSIRCERDLTYDPRENTFDPQMWIWIMLSNIGIEPMSNQWYDYDAAECAIQTVLNRGYSSSGDGSLFPVEESRQDMRKLGLWAQFCNYLNENPNLLYR